MSSWSCRPILPPKTTTTKPITQRSAPFCTLRWPSACNALQLGAVGRCLAHCRLGVLTLQGWVLVRAPCAAGNPSSPSCRIFLQYGVIQSLPLPSLITGCQLRFHLCFSLVPYLSELITINPGTVSLSVPGLCCFAGCSPAKDTPVWCVSDLPGLGILLSRDKGSIGIWSRWIPFPRHVARPESPAAWLFCVYCFPYLLHISWECAAGLSICFWEA